MHVADPSVGILGANAIVGAGIPLATGAGLSSKLLGTRRAWRSAFFGEGAVNQGTFHEAVNLAAIWDLPVLFVCENNRYAEFTDSAHDDPGSRRRRAGRSAYGIWARHVDGNDVGAVYDAAQEAVSDCRAGDGPVADRSRRRTAGTAITRATRQPYKPDAEADAWKSRDPLLLAEPRCCARAPATETELAAVRDRRRASASTTPWSSLAQRPSPPARRPMSMSSSTESAVRYSEAISQGLADAMEEDERVVLMGIDVGARRWHLHDHPRALRALRPRTRTRHADQRDGLRRCRRRRGDDRPAADRRDHVHGLHRRLPGPDHESGGEASLHDRRRARRSRSCSVRKPAPAAAPARSTRRASRRCSPTSPG